MRRGFVSLTWQVTLSVGLILTLGVGLITYFGRSYLEQTYIDERERVFNDRQLSIITALHSIQTQLVNLASHLQGQATQLDKQRTIKQRLIDTANGNWDQLNFEWEVDALLLFGPDKQTWLSLGMPSVQQLLPENWLEQVYQSGVQKNKIICRKLCWQVVAAPVLIGSRENGAMVLVKSLSDAVIEFQTATATDVGILVPYTTHSQGDSLRNVPRWKRSIVALTGGPSNIDIINESAKHYSLADLASPKTLELAEQDKLEISLVPLTDHESPELASLIIIENVEAALQQLRSTISTLFFIALLILACAAAAMFKLLWSPMSQLRKVAVTLPKLAKGRLQKDQVIEPATIGAGQLRNEIHDLQDSAVALSEKLMMMDKQIKQRTLGLRVRSRELLAERDFATTLINNVQAVILTQDSEGVIDLINNEGSVLIGTKIDDNNRTLKKITFLSSFKVTGNAEIREGLASLAKGESEHYRYESEFRNKGQKLFIQWHHSLLPAIGNERPMVLSVGIDLTSHKAAEDNLAWLADHDHLTKLFNRRHFQREFEQILKRSERQKTSGALLFFDIDQFKLINDTSGHPAGDRLLCEVAYRLSLGIRDIDVFSRLGGDEFALLVEHVSSEGSITLARKLSDIVSGIEINLNGAAHNISISIGVVNFPEHGKTVDELMANVDLAMYKAKSLNNAHSNWEMYSHTDTSKDALANTVDWRGRIQKALANQRFILHYQPIYDIAKKTISHHEALVRMLDDDDQTIAPINFIPVAEQTGYIVDIDRFVVTQAMSDLKSLSQEDPDVHIAINLCAKTLANNEFIELLKELCYEDENISSRVIFELTETAAVDDVQITADIIQICKAMGFQFSIDDFGIGYASWQHLRELPVDFVKIDGSFVKNLASNPEDYLFVRAINDVAQGLGKKTIAEFVENEASLALVSELGIDYAQGYYIGKPTKHIQQLAEFSIPPKLKVELCKPS